MRGNLPGYKSEWKAETAKSQVGGEGRKEGAAHEKWTVWNRVRILYQGLSRHALVKVSMPRYHPQK